MPVSALEVKKAIVIELRKNTALMTALKDTSATWENGNIYLDHVSDLPQAYRVFPSISITKISDKNDHTWTGKEIILQIDVWTKNGNAKAQEILDQVDLTLNLKQISYNNINIALIVQTDGLDAYQNINYTSHCLNRYKIKVT